MYVMQALPFIVATLVVAAAQPMRDWDVSKTTMIFLTDTELRLGRINFHENITLWFT